MVTQLVTPASLKKLLADSPLLSICLLQWSCCCVCLCSLVSFLLCLHAVCRWLMHVSMRHLTAGYSSFTEGAAVMIGWLLVAVCRWPVLSAGTKPAVCLRLHPAPLPPVRFVIVADALNQPTTSRLFVVTPAQLLPVCAVSRWPMPSTSRLRTRALTWCGPWRVGSTCQTRSRS